MLTITEPTVGVELPMIKPLLRWCGSKYRSKTCDAVNLEFAKHLIKNQDAFYLAPFGGAIGDLHRIVPQNAVVADNNRSLILMYRGIRNGSLKDFHWYSENIPEIYYEVRERFNAFRKQYFSFEDETGSIVEWQTLCEFILHPELRRSILEICTVWNSDRREQAVLDESTGIETSDSQAITRILAMMEMQISSDFIWLNRTCMNGVYRVNKNNGFNVPIGGRQTKKGMVPIQPPEIDLGAYKSLYKNWHFLHSDYESFPSDLSLVPGFGEFKSQFIYADPIYAGSEPIYSPENKFDQVKLAHTLKTWAEMGNTVCTSNSFNDELVTLYEKLGFTVYDAIAVQYNVSPLSVGRSKVKEMFAIIRES